MVEGTAAITAQTQGQPAPSRRFGLCRALIGVGLIVLAVGAAGHDLASFAVSGRYDAATLGEIWFALDVSSLNLVQAVIQRFLHPGLWDPVIVWLLRWPLWSLLGGPGVALAIIYFARRR